MWAPVALELGIPWRAAEAMHWQLGEADMARRAGVVPFSLAANNVSSAIPTACMAPNQIMPPALCTAPHIMPGPIGLPPTPAAYGMGPNSFQPAGDNMGARLHRSGSGGLKRELGPPIPPPAPIAAPPNSAPMHNILPSMAELERGLTAPEGPERYQERRQ